MIKPIQRIERIPRIAEHAGERQSIHSRNARLDA